MKSIHKYIFHKINKRHVDEKHANENKFEVDLSVACEGKLERQNRPETQ